MVGVPGKSKGCHTCRRRRVKCDEGKPDCQRCVKGNRQCEGYDRRAVFLNRTAEGLSKRKHLEEASLRSEQTQPTTLPTPPPEGEPMFCELVVRGKMDRIEQELSPPASPSPRNVVLNGLAGYFHQKYVPYPWRTSRGMQSSGNWMVSILAMSERGPALENALSSLIAVQAGKDQGNAELQRYARMMYTRALYYLQETLTNEQVTVTDETMAAVSCLQNYELQEATSASPEGFNAHTKGLEQLVLRRGNQDWTTNLAMQVRFEAIFTSMVLALQYRKRSPLAHSNWSSSEWFNPMDVHLALLKCGFQLTETIADLDALIRLPPGDEAMVMAGKLYLEIYDARLNLAKWHSRLVETTDLALDWPLPTLVPSHSQQPQMHRTGIHIDTLHQYLMVVDYWVLYCFQWRLSSLLRPLVMSDIQERIPELNILETIQCVESIAQIAPLFLAEENGMYCTRRMVLPSRFALEIARYVEGERARQLEQRFNAILDLTTSARGIRHAKFIRTKSGGWEYMMAQLQKHVRNS